MRLFLALAISAFATSAWGRIIDFDLRDEIAGKVDYFVQMRADDYSEYTYENYIQFQCSSNGSLFATWHTGGQFSGSSSGDDAVISFKIDNGKVITATVDDLAEKFIPALRKGSRLVVKRGVPAAGGSSSSFPLDGATKAFAPFKSQCNI